MPQILFPADQAIEDDAVKAVVIRQTVLWEVASDEIHRKVLKLNKSETGN